MVEHPAFNRVVPSSSLGRGNKITPGPSADMPRPTPWLHGQTRRFVGCLRSLLVCSGVTLGTFLAFLENRKALPEGVGLACKA